MLLNKFKKGHTICLLQIWCNVPPFRLALQMEGKVCNIVILLESVQQLVLWSPWNAQLVKFMNHPDNLQSGHLYGCDESFKMLASCSLICQAHFILCHRLQECTGQQDLFVAHSYSKFGWLFVFFKSQSCQGGQEGKAGSQETCSSKCKGKCLFPFTSIKSGMLNCKINWKLNWLGFVDP